MRAQDTSSQCQAKYWMPFLFFKCIVFSVPVSIKRSNSSPSLISRIKNTEDVCGIFVASGGYIFLPSNRMFILPYRNSPWWMLWHIHETFLMFIAIYWGVLWKSVCLFLLHIHLHFCPHIRIQYICVVLLVYTHACMLFFYYYIYLPNIEEVWSFSSVWTFLFGLFLFFHLSFFYPSSYAS